MKKKNYIQVFKYLIVALLGSLSLSSCKGEEPKVKTDATQTEAISDEEKELRAYIDKNYTLPYNIDVVYKWEGQAKEIGSYAYPPRIDKALTVLKAIKFLLLDLCEDKTVFPKNFLKGKAPIIIRLFGGEGHNASGLELIASPKKTAVEFYIYNVNNFNPAKQDDFFILYRSLLHQFALRLGDLQTYDREAFAKISANHYISDDKGIVDALENLERRQRFFFTRYANTEGFLTPYAMRSYEADFAENFAMFLLATSVEMKKTLNENLAVHRDEYIGAMAEYERDKQKAKLARRRIEEKQNLVKAFFDKTYKIKLTDLRMLCLNRLYEYKKYDEISK